MFQCFRRNEDVGNLLLRLFIGIRLIYGVQDNILHWDDMKQFEGFLAQFGFPFPLVCAVVSVYAQAVAGLMFILGWKVRWAALLMLVNFLVALVMVHWGESFEQLTTVLFMIFTSILLLLKAESGFHWTAAEISACTSSWQWSLLYSAPGKSSW